MLLKLSINGEKHEADVEPRLLLVHLIREVLRLTGTHIGCDTTHCGACTVLMDGRAVKSCTVFAVQARGKELCEATVVSGTPEDRGQHAARGQRSASWRDQAKSTHGIFLTMDGPMSRVSATGSRFHVLMARPYFEFSGLTSGAARPPRDQ